jgi:hypothetical protein
MERKFLGVGVAEVENFGKRRADQFRLHAPINDQTNIKQTSNKQLALRRFNY